MRRHFGHTKKYYCKNGRIIETIYLLPDIIKSSADRFPDHVAFRYESKSMTFEELLKRSNQLAFTLSELGVKRGDRVGVFLDPSLDSPVAVYGIMCAGAVFVPMDPNAPPARNAYVINDCGIRQIITGKNQSRSLNKVLNENVSLEVVIGLNDALPVKTVSWEDIDRINTSQTVSVRMLEDDLAYIMYTSGTTGIPKGIMHSHRSGLAYAKLSMGLYDVQPTDVLANHSPLHFDISTMGYFTMPLAGGTTVLVPESHKLIPASLSKLMEKERITIWYSVPLALIHLLQRGALEDRKLDALRWVLFGGEPFPPKHLKSLMKLWNQATFSNVYGPAEVNQCTYFHLLEVAENEAAIPLGHVWNNTEVLIVDSEGSEVAEGDTGELLVRTATMMKGYWGKPELNQKAFFKRERFPNAEEIFYRTGDLVWRKNDGLLNFAGRKDRQIKVRGYRIELDEIESVLLSHPYIIETAVYNLKDGDDHYVEALVVLSKPGGETEEELKNYLAKKCHPMHFPAGYI
ncbi:MAG: amino acid adenylation domain-containing protein [Chitinophagaceae bacterium]|nr:MAG: amino acid adenylation domain-containing protein [Chitinophagaceae bacterium]